MYMGYGARDVIVAGDSAGGNLALELALKLKEQGRAQPRGLVLFSPWTDMTASGKSYRTCKTLDPMLTMEYIAAVREALDHTPTKLEQGNVGAGTGATVGKLMGPATCMKAGLGAAAVALGPVKVGAVVSVNACGNVVDPFTGEWVAGMRAAADSDQIVDMELAAFAAAGSMQMPLDRTNTTISCIVTNVELTKAQATKVSQMAADAYAHAIRPTHTTNDGDTIYTLASGKLGTQASATVPLDLLGMLAVRALQTAIVNGAKTAKTSHGIPGAAK